ncbi:hypothetical protein SAMN05421812_112181 [Asanoa hainanensis]|uniref:Uncharacterized protein n=2 Tax=Asanoa hainanensis TaxID=560556 RepID=A0A239P0X2_9ACTN|nr:hypothetical protein SAMN05421812_112181 [Asanoa hainanensis]
MDGYARWYRRLLRLYPKPYRERFAVSMEQTFTDLRRERAGVLWIFTETFAGIVRERATDLGRLAMTSNVFRIVKFAALAVAGLMVAGIVTVMLLARGTGEDITGVVAPALLLVVLSVVAFVVATVMQGRQRKRDVAG